MDDLRKVVFWGTGEISVKIMETMELPEPEFYIDNSKEKQGKIHLSKVIKHPTEISQWDNYFVIVVTDYYQEVAKQLNQYGLKEDFDYVYYKNKIGDMACEDMIAEIDSNLIKLMKQTELYQEKIIIFSDFLSYDRGVCKFVNSWNELYQCNKIALFSEATWLLDQNTQKMDIDVHILPQMFGKNRYVKSSYKNRNGKEFKDKVTKEYLIWAAYNLRLRHPDMLENYEYVFSYYADYYVRTVINLTKPQKIILWNAFHAFHNIINNICKELCIPVEYMEFGNLPGTIFIEKEGQMGESYPSKEPSEFLKIQVNEKELHEAVEVWKYLKKTGLNRNIQPNNGLIHEIKKKIDIKRPTVFYAGQNDFESGLQPYTENTRIYHSPIFHSSYDAAVFLSKICEKNQWNFIYKPHPIISMFSKEKVGLCSEAITVDKVDINELVDLADVTVTILSTVSYVALVRENPTLMLGYTQLKDKGCTYQAFDSDSIEKQLINAIKSGFTDEQKHNFTKHIAQLIKYCSYDDMQPREIRYGKKLEKLIEE